MTKFQQGALVMAPILSGAYIKWRFSLEETALESSQSLKFLYPFYPQQNIHHILNHRSPQSWNFKIQKISSWACKIDQKSDILPFSFSFARSRISKSFGKWIMIDFELSYFFILIGGDGDEFSFFENVCSKRCHWNLWNIGTANQVETRLIFVHWIQHSLKISVKIGSKWGQNRIKIWSNSGQIWVGLGSNLGRTWVK